MLDRDMNQVVLATIAVGALCFVFVRRYDISVLYWITMYLLMILVAFFNIKSFRITTIVYSGAFILSFLFFQYLIKENWISTKDYYEILCLFIYMLIGIQILQQIGYLFGIRTINAMRTAYGNEQERICFCSIASEPSHYSRVLFIYSFSYELIKGVLKENVSHKRDVITRICIFWGFVTMGSVTALMSYILLILFLAKKPTSIVFGVIVLLFFVYLIGYFVDIAVLNRAQNFAKGILSLNSDILLENEHSGGVRVAPILIFFNDAVFSDVLWGKGVDASIDLFYGKIFGVNMDDYRGGIFPSQLYNYGLFSFIFFLLAIKHSCIRNKSYKDWLIFLYVITICPFNFQYTWLTFMLMAINKYMLEKDRQISLTEPNVDIPPQRNFRLNPL